MIKRDYYLYKLIRKMNSGLIKVITGIRRCGKSFLLFHIFRDYFLSKGIKKENIISIELDRLSFEKLRDPYKLYEYVLIILNLMKSILYLLMKSKCVIILNLY
ncbi:MAG: AAA family ATPase [Bacillales bacterium]|nr:AAA family ATPase [Bacillales bacterium]